MTKVLRRATFPKCFGRDKNKIESPFQADLERAPEKQKILKAPPLFRWWIKIGYFGLCIPFKSVLDTSGSYKLQYNKFQKVILPYFSIRRNLAILIIVLIHRSSA